MVDAYPLLAVEPAVGD